MDLIMGEIDKDIASQKHSIETGMRALNQQEGLVGKIYAATGDMYQAQETARLAVLQGLSAEIDVKLAQMDPEGTQAMQLEQKKRSLDVMAQERVQAIAQQTRKEAIEMADFDIKQREQLRKEQETAAKVAKMQQEARILSRKGRGGGRKKTGVIKYLSPDKQREYVAQGYAPYTIDGAVQALPGEQAAALRAQAPAEGREAVAIRKEQAMTAKYERENVQYEQQRMEQVGLSGMLTKDGKQIYAGDKTAAEKYRALGAALDTSTGILDDIAIAYEDHGMEFFGSAEGKRMKARASAALLEIKTVAELGVLAGPDMGIVQDMLGSDNFNSAVRDPTAAIRSTQKYMKDKYNDKLRKLNKDAALYNPPRKHKAVSSERTPEELSASISQGIPKAFMGDPGKEEKALGQMRSDAERYAKHANPSEAAIKALGSNVKANVQSGNITQEQAAHIMEPTAINLAKHIKSRMEMMSPAELTKMQNDPKAMRRLRLAHDVLAGKPAAVYEFIAGPTDLVLGYKGREAPQGSAGLDAETAKMLKSMGAGDGE